MSEEFSRDRFASAVGTPFTMTAKERAIDLELIEVSEVRERPHQTSYSILFRVPENQVVEQGLYDLQHADLGEMQLFLVPIIPIGNQMRLEAVFNFLKKQEEPPNG